MESLPDFQRIIEAVINHRMTGRAAAKKLKTSEPNFSQYMSRHYPKHKPKRKKRAKEPDPRAIKVGKDGEPAITIQLNSSQSNAEWGTGAWRDILQNLTTTLTTEPDLELNDQLKIAKTLLDLLKFQFSHSVPEISKPQIEIDKRQEKRIIDQVLADHDEWCHYRNQAIARKDKAQSKARLEPAEPPPVERPGNRS